MWVVAPLSTARVPWRPRIPWAVTSGTFAVLQFAAPTGAANPASGVGIAEILWLLSVDASDSAGGTRRPQPSLARLSSIMGIHSNRPLVIQIADHPADDLERTSRRRHHRRHRSVLPLVRDSIAFDCHLRASSIRSRAFPCRRLPSLSPRRGDCEDPSLPTHQRKNDFASASMFLCESTASGRFVVGIVVSARRRSSPLPAPALAVVILLAVRLSLASIRFVLLVPSIHAPFDRTPPSMCTWREPVRYVLNRSLRGLWKQSGSTDRRPYASPITRAASINHRPDTHVGFTDQPRRPLQ